MPVARNCCVVYRTTQRLVLFAESRSDRCPIAIDALTFSYEQSKQAMGEHSSGFPLSASMPCVGVSILPPNSDACKNWVCLHLHLRSSGPSALVDASTFNLIFETTIAHPTEPPSLRRSRTPSQRVSLHSSQHSATKVSGQVATTHTQARNGRQW
jgi:hypothetical protein